MTTPPEDAPTECAHDANALLDFHVNGSLEAEEAAMVAAHVAECATCARDVRELQSLSRAIETHGTAAPAGGAHGRRVGTWAATVAAVLVIGAGMYSVMRRGAGEGAPSSQETGRDSAGAELVLDLGTGGLRDAGTGPPGISLGPDAATLRLTFLPPVLPGEDLVMSVHGPDDETLIDEAALPPLDEMGRATIAIPASSFPRSGTYRVILRSAAGQDRPGPFTFPFEVTVPSNRE
jgi:hypothetical protein